jgi:hypothetical protein
MQQAVVAFDEREIVVMMPMVVRYLLCEQIFLESLFLLQKIRPFLRARIHDRIAQEPPARLSCTIMALS